MVSRWALLVVGAGVAAAPGSARAEWFEHVGGGEALMVLPRLQGPMVHTQFDALGEFLCPGDLLVVNTSRTLPALLRAHDEEGKPVEVRLAHRRSDEVWALTREYPHDLCVVGPRIGFGRTFSVGNSVNGWGYVGAAFCFPHPFSAGGRAVAL